MIELSKLKPIVDFIKGDRFKKILNLFTLVSVAFLVYFLYKFDFIRLKDITVNFTDLILSLLVMLGAMIIGVWIWKISLKAYGITVDYRWSLISQSRSIIGKYIPGKIWGILGRAAFISQQGHKLVITSFISTKLQILSVLIGLLVGIVPLLFIQKTLEYLPLFGLLCIVIVIVIFSENVQAKIFNLVSQKTSGKIVFPTEDPRQLLWIKILIFLQYLVYSLSFFFFVRSFFPGAEIITGFAFPLALNFSLLIFIIPNGIGFREGAIVWFLQLTGVPVSLSIIISIAARLWMIAGELVIFIVSLFLERGQKNSYGIDSGNNRDQSEIDFGETLNNK
jgi:uncharacterized membrane protein YbhN (UPF0104 family)